MPEKITRLAWTHHPRLRGIGLIYVALASFIYVFAASRGVVTVDVARDLYWADQVATGQLFPLLGPSIGGMNLLGPVWFYVASVAAAGTVSFTAYFGWLAALAAAKFALAYSVGRMWRGPQMAIALVAASALPGLASYQLFGVTHPQMVEVTVWGCAWFATRYRASAHGAHAFGVGVMAGLAMHAHPTVVFLAPWALAALLQPEKTLRTVRQRGALRTTLVALLSALIGAALVFAPRILAAAAPLVVDGAVVSVGAAPSPVGTVSTVWTYLANLVWMQPSYFAHATVPRFASTLLLVLAGIWLITAVGLARALSSQAHRRAALAAAATLVACLIGVALIREYTPFYMLFVALPPLALVIAVSWCALLDFAWGKRVWVSAILAALLLHAVTAVGLAQEGRRGLFDFPVEVNMKSMSSELRRDIYVTARTRDALTAWLCARPTSMALHGALALALDTSLQLELTRGCPPPGRRVRVAGAAPAYVGILRSDLARVGVQTAEQVGAFGLVPVRRVLAPAAELRSVSGQHYPPRLNEMMASATTPSWGERVMLERGELLLVSGLLPMPGFSVSAAADGKPMRPVIHYSGTRVFVCADCEQAAVNWQIEVSGMRRDFTSIVTFTATR